MADSNNIDPFENVKDTQSWLSLQKKPYKILHSEGVAEGAYIIYCHADAKYYSKGKQLLDDKTMEKILPYLTWKYDELVPEEVEVVEEWEEEVETKTKSGNSTVKKVPKKRTVKKQTGRMINKFPPTTENIVAKRKELQSEISVDGQIPDAEEMKKLYYSASPRLRCHEEFEDIQNRLGQSRAKRLAQHFRQGLF